MLRPSSLPILAACSQFESRGGNEYTEAGQVRHDAVWALVCCELGGNDGAAVTEADRILAELEPEDQEAVRWAADYIAVNAPARDHPIHFERRVHPVDAGFLPLFTNGGTMDCDCGPELFDLKSRVRNYWEQMAAYALAIIQESGFESVRVHVMFMVPRRAEVRVLTEADCWALINPVIANAGQGPANPCDYCSWCAKQLTCPAVLNQVNTVVAGREDWALEQYHASQIATADEMGKALALASHLTKWAQAVKHFALEMVTKQGLVPTGYEVKTSKGKAFITDASAAFQLAGLDQATFLKCCDVRQNDSKKYPDKVGLANELARRDGIAVSRARKIMKEKLSPVISAGKDGIKLVPVKGGTDEEEGDE